MTVGEIVLKIMRDRDWSRSCVSRHVGVSPSTVQGWTLGNTPRADNLASLLVVAGMTLADVDFTSGGGKRQHDKVDE